MSIVTVFTRANSIRPFLISDFPTAVKEESWARSECFTKAFSKTLWHKEEEEKRKIN